MSSPMLGSSLSSGQDQLHPRVDLTMRELYAMQKEFTRYLNLEELIPKLIANGMLSDSEVYTIKNPYLPPNQRVFELLQCVSNKGPSAPSKLLDCLMEKPIIPGHMYLASRLSGNSTQDASQRMSLHFEPKISKDVVRKIDNLKYMFADLLLETHSYLVTSGVSVEKFRIFVSFMSASRNNSSSLFFRDHLPSLSSVSTIDQIITIINENRYWNHFNYQLLEAVIRKFGNKSMQTQLEEYIDSVVTFENTVSLSEYTQSLPKDLSIPNKHDFTPVKTTLTSENNWDSFTMAETRALQTKMCGELNLRGHSLLFQTAEEGSVVITWLVPMSVKDSVIVRAQNKKKELCSIGISSLEINKVTVITNSCQDDYENIASVPAGSLSRRASGDLSAILVSLESMEKSMKDMSVSLHHHKQAIVQKLYGGGINPTADSYQFLSPLYHTDISGTEATRLSPINTPMVPVRDSVSPSFLLRSKSRSPSPRIFTSPSHELVNEVLGNTVEESEREDVARWLPDSGYDERNEWTASS